MTPTKYKGLRLFLWGVFRYKWLLSNKHISRDQIILEIKHAEGLGDAGAEWTYAYSVGLFDGSDIYMIDEDGYIIVSERAMKRRKKYMREGDIEWWYGNLSNQVRQ